MPMADIAISGTTAVRDIVVAFPQTRRVFEAFGVDYCCNGQMELGAAVQRAGADYARLVRELEEAVRRPVGERPGRDWSGAGLDELARHILDTHHAFMRRQMPRIDRLMDTVTCAHRAHADMLIELRRVFDTLRLEIDAHLMKEEAILFPYIQRLDAMVGGREEPEPMHCGTVANPIRQMEHEHDSAGNALAEIRSLTDNFTLPADACPTFAELYQSLQELEADLHEHIHLENNILFPKAIQAEAAVCTR